MGFLIYLIFGCLLSWGLTKLVIAWAKSKNLLDLPNERKWHKTPIPLGGGIAIWLAFSIVILITLVFYPQHLLGRDLSFLKIGAISLASLVIIVGGYLDDKYNLSPLKQFIAPTIAALIIVLAGIGVSYVSNPFGGLLFLDSLKFGAYNLGNQTITLGVWGSIFTFLWLMGMMYTTKLLDGLDGLASGIGVIGALIIFGLTMIEQWFQPSIGLVAIIFSGCALGFLIHNFHPAKVFLGEGGSLYIGFMLGVLAIVSGGKIATALLVMGIPILDVVWVIIRRLWVDKTGVATADRRHLHHRLLDVGFSHRQAVVFLYFLTGCFGVASLFLHTQGKLMALSILILVMLILATSLVVAYKRKIKKTGVGNPVS